MLDLKTTAAAVLALSMSAGVAFAQTAASQDEGGRTFPRPGTTVGEMQMDQSTYDAFVSDEATGSVREDADFAERWRAMSPEEQDKIRTNCGQMEQEKALFSDKVHSLCKSISAP
ncbi:hypothetical protein ATN84_24315 [Paramesorhizobium deserti]|uniref:Uncharacterized protein n=1 Tax=Paramesorhizobium deserti TaxID=1494590 RepID=A0A135HY03_9HYPH|nr:hypothetical protein [Paramesorhizobium deserti]KXF78086.1 hypothetical protein ATN84_24315 [Paramesorhizobium deserti]